MILQILRAAFILIMAAIGYWFLSQTPLFHPYTWLTEAFTLTVAVLLVCVDILSPRRKLAVFSGTFLGLLVGLLIAYAFSFVVRIVVDQAVELGLRDLLARLGHGSGTQAVQTFEKFLNLMVGTVCVYLSISFILQTKDDFRFIIPYVEFSKQSKGARPVLIDTSVLVDGRIIDIATTGFIESTLIVPRFTLDELQLIADSPDKLKRNRGRRGLDILTRLRDSKSVEVVIYDSSVHDESEMHGVDQKLLALAKQLKARILTTDFNLNKVAQLRGVDVININDLSNALRPIILPGEKITLRLINPGEGENQGVGYLEDGTMVVVEQGRDHLGQEVEVTVNRIIQTSAGRMVFGRAGDGAASNSAGAGAASASAASANPQRRPRPRHDGPSQS